MQLLLGAVFASASQQFCNLISAKFLLKFGQESDGLVVALFTQQVPGLLQVAQFSLLGLVNAQRFDRRRISPSPGIAFAGP